MKTINNYTESEEIIKKSKFITKIYYINNISDVDNILNNLKIEYKDATHICYAYIFDNSKRCSDNGEPIGTAGMPLLNVLEKKELQHVLAVVIRYFGGIKLGVGGLTRAYANCLVDTINNCEIKALVQGIRFEITYNYDTSKEVEKLLQNCKILAKSFNNNIKLLLETTLSNYNIIEPILNNYCQIQIKEHLLIIE